MHAEYAMEALMDPTISWGTLGAHVVEAKGARGARAGGGVTVRSLSLREFAAVLGGTMVFLLLFKGTTVV